MDATELLERVFRLDPDHVASLLTLGDVLAARPERDGVAAAYHRALQLRPLDVSLHDKLGAVLLDSRRFAQAASIYRAAIALDDNDLRLRFRVLHRTSRGRCRSLQQQEKPQAWDGVIARVADELGRMACMNTRARRAGRCELQPVRETSDIVVTVVERAPIFGD